MEEGKVEKQVSNAHNEYIIDSQLETKRLPFETIVAKIACVEIIESSLGSAAVDVPSDELEIDEDKMIEKSLALYSTRGPLEICNSIFNDEWS